MPVLSPEMPILYTNDDRLYKAVRDAINPQRVDAQRVRVSMFPARADCIVTLGQINADTEFLAMRLRATATVTLPEATMWLLEKVQSGEIQVMAGADLSRADTKGLR